jgi:hypothetical protein
MSKSKRRSAIFLKNDKWAEWQDDIRIKRTNIKNRKNARSTFKYTTGTSRSL